MAEERALYKLDPQLVRHVESRSPKLFRARPGHPQIELSTVHKIKRADGRWVLQANQGAVVNDAAELRRVREKANDACVMVYTIQHIRTWTPLNISYELFQELLLTQNVFHHFLRSVLTFGIRLEENEYRFPSFRSQSSQLERQSIEELTYVIRRVERHDRTPTNAWSVRQTGVYHKLIYEELSEPKSTFIILAPSPLAHSEVADKLSEQISEHDNMKAAFSVHERLVADSLRGWMEYMMWLEEVTDQNRNGILASYLDGGEVYFSADDRQTLKMYEDRITDMLVILQTMANTIGRIGRTCRRHCDMSCQEGGSCSCSYMIHEFEEYAEEAQQYLDRARILMSRVQSTAHLLADLLAYDEARALKQLTKASHEESQSIVDLTIQTAEDAAAVKVLTLVGLVFLPLTTVSNFFSTQFVKVNDHDRVHVSRDVWWLPAVAVPFTMLTFFLWWIALRLNRTGKLPWLQKLFQITPVTGDVEGAARFGRYGALPFLRTFTRQATPKCE